MIEILQREWVYLWYYFTIQLEQIFKFWVIGIVLGLVISVFGKQKIQRLFVAMQNKRLGALGVIPAGTLGIASPLCMYVTIHIAASFSEKGMKDDWLTAFMMSSAFMITVPATKITNLGAMKIVLGVKRFIIYIIFGMAFAFVSGLLVDLIL